MNEDYNAGSRDSVPLAVSKAVSEGFNIQRITVALCTLTRQVQAEGRTIRAVQKKTAEVVTSKMVVASMESASAQSQKSARLSNRSR